MRTGRFHRIRDCLSKVGLFVVLGFISGCSSGDVSRYGNGPDIIRIKGSDTMFILVERWAEEYMKSHADVAIYVDGGGTGSGVESLIAGDADICAASRTLKAKEARELLKRQNSLGMSFLCARDALRIEGEFTLVDNDGNKYDLGGRKVIYLCRCGFSGNKPFCDGAHKAAGFSEGSVARALPPLKAKN